MNAAGERIRARLASTQGRKDEAPNIQLAEDLAQSADVAGIAETAEILRTGKAAEKSDAIKVLYELGARNPEMIAPHFALLLTVLESRNNRLLWGALTAIAALAPAAPTLVAAHLDAVLDAAGRGSIIAKDRAVDILVALKSAPETKAQAARHMMDVLHSAAINQLPMYAENMVETLEPGEIAQFCEILIVRLSAPVPIPDSKHKRIEKAMAKARKISAAG